MRWAMVRVRVLRALAFLWASLLAGEGTHGAATASSGPWVLDRLAALVHPRVHVLDGRIRAMEVELKQLPDWRPYGQTARLGYQSLNTKSEGTRWVQVDLGSVHRVDRVVVVPVQMSFTRHLGPFGMPVAFRVEISENAGFGAGTWIGVYPPLGGENPDGLPAMIDAGGRLGRHVRLTATKLWRAADSELFVIGELMVLSGSRNIAANLPAVALAASDSLEQPPTWSLSNLVDCHSSLGVPVFRADRDSIGCMARPGVAKEGAWIQVDLGEELPIDELRLVPIVPDVLRAEFGPSVGLPRRIAVETAPATSPFERRTLDVPRSLFAVNPGRSPVVVPAGGRRARYVRVTHAGPQGGPMPLAELQVYSGGTNAALGRPVAASHSKEDPPKWGAARLVDGVAYGRTLVEWPEFLDGIVRMRAIQSRLADLHEERLKCVAACSRMLRAFSVGSVVLAVVVVTVVWRMARGRQAQLAAVKDQIMKDIHDEVGSGLGAIGLISQLAIEEAGDARIDMVQINRLSHELNEALRNLVWLSGPGEESVTDLGRRLGRTAPILLPGIETRVDVAGGAAGQNLPLGVRREILLFVKEALHNVGAHAAAGRVTIMLMAERRRLRVEVCDDGRGFDPHAAGCGTGMRSMRSRALATGGRFEIESRPGRGTRVGIDMPLAPGKRIGRPK